LLLMLMLMLLLVTRCGNLLPMSLHLHIMSPNIMLGSGINQPALLPFPRPYHMVYTMLQFKCILMANTANT
jgi:hypothetical protein